MITLTALVSSMELQRRLLMKPSMPMRSRSLTVSIVFSAERMRILISGKESRSRRAMSMPVVSGRMMSRKMRSGFNVLSRVKSCLPLSASPKMQTSARLSDPRMPSRKSSWSSTNITLVIIGRFSLSYITIGSQKYSFSLLRKVPIHRTFAALQSRDVGIKNGSGTGLTSNARPPTTNN